MIEGGQSADFVLRENELHALMNETIQVLPSPMVHHTFMPNLNHSQHIDYRFPVVALRQGLEVTHRATINRSYYLQKSRPRLHDGTLAPRNFVHGLAETALHVAGVDIPDTYRTFRYANFVGVLNPRQPAAVMRAEKHASRVRPDARIGDRELFEQKTTIEWFRAIKDTVQPPK